MAAQGFGDQWHGEVRRKGYDFKAELGRGSYGTVYKVVDRHNNNNVFCVKAIKSITPEVEELAQKEVKVLKSIDHPYITK